MPYVTLRTHFCGLSPLCAGSRAAHNGESPQKTDVGDCWPSNNVGIGRRPATSVLSLALSAYRFGGLQALNSASQHSTDSGPWPAEVLSLGSSRALAGGCWFLVLVLVADALSFSHRLSPSSPYPYSPSQGDNQCLACALHFKVICRLLALSKRARRGVVCLQGASNRCAAQGLGIGSRWPRGRAWGCGAQKVLSRGQW